MVVKAKKGEHELFDALADYTEWENILIVLRFARKLSEYPIEMIIVKHLIEDGVDTEEKLTELLKKIGIYQPILVDMQNYFRDITRNDTDIKKIPSLPLLIK